MRLPAAACLLVALLGCAPREPAGTIATPAPPAAAAPIPSEPAMEAETATPPASPTPAAAPIPATTGNAQASTPASPVAVSPDAASSPPSLACDTDADCAVKDVGSCCGYRPACVNADAPTFPEQAKARCAAEGRVGTCGFAAIDGCRCVAGQCAATRAAIGPAPPAPLQ